MGIIAKIFFVIVVIAACIVWVRRQQALRQRFFGFKTTMQEKSSSEVIVPCAHCGLYLPLHEAIKTKDGAYFCSEVHRSFGRDKS